MYRRFAAGLLVIVVCGFAVTAVAAPTFPVLTGRVVDDANIIPPATESEVGSSRVDLQACKLEYSIVSPK